MYKVPETYHCILAESWWLVIDTLEKQAELYVEGELRVKGGCDMNSTSMWPFLVLCFQEGADCSTKPYFAACFSSCISEMEPLLTPPPSGSAPTSHFIPPVPFKD